jgi:hypothetical protein
MSEDLAFVLRLRELSKFSKGRSMSDQYYLNLFRASEGTLSRWFRLQLALAFVSTHQSTLGPRGGLWPILLMSSLCPRWDTGLPSVP